MRIIVDKNKQIFLGRDTSSGDIVISLVDVASSHTIKTCILSEERLSEILISEMDKQEAESSTLKTNI